jgi:phospholipase/carboxylesterase
VTTPTGAAGLGSAPVVARWGTGHPSAPLIVTLHGGGASEASMIGLAPWLPPGPVAYAAVRGPVEDGAGFTWAAGPDLRPPMRWLLDWLDTEGDPERPVVLLGFAAGAELAATLLVNHPDRWAGGILLHGSLPPIERGRFLGIPVFRCGDASGLPESGAPLTVTDAPSADGLAGQVVGEVAAWLGDRLEHLRSHGENPLPDDDEPAWPTVPGGRLTPRSTPATPDPGSPVVLPMDLAYDAAGKGWALAAPRAGVGADAGSVLLHTPQDAAERAVVDAIAEAARLHATP